MVSPDASELAVGEARSRGRERAARCCIIAIGCARFPRLIGDFMVVLNISKDENRKGSDSCDGCLPYEINLAKNVVVTS